MYKVERLVPLVDDFIHTDKMYRVKRLSKLLDENVDKSVTDHSDVTLYNKLLDVDKRTTFLLDLFKLYHSMHRIESTNKSDSDHRAKNLCKSFKQTVNHLVSDCSEKTLYDKLLDMDKTLTFLLGLFKLYNKLESDNLVYNLCKSIKETSDQTETNRILYDQILDMDKTVTLLLSLFELYHLKRKYELSECTHLSRNISLSNELSSKLFMKKYPTVVVHTNPLNPPISLLLYCHLFNTMMKEKICPRFFKLSNVNKLPNSVENLLNKYESSISTNSNLLEIHFVWSSKPVDCIYFLNSQCSLLYGESMLLLHIHKLFHPDNYEQISSILFMIDHDHILNKKLNLKKLDNHPYFSNLNRDHPSIVDCFLFTLIHRMNLSQSLPSNLKIWYSFCLKWESFLILTKM